MRKNKAFEDIVGGLLGLGMIGGMMGGVGLFIVLVMLMVTFVDAFVLMKMWNWYIPLMTDEFKIINLPIAISFILMVRLVLGTFRHTKPDVMIPKEKETKQENNQMESNANQDSNQSPNGNPNGNQKQVKKITFTPFFNFFITPLFILLIGYLMKTLFL